MLTLKCLFEFQIEIRKLREEIRAKNEQIASLEKQIADTVAANYDKMDDSEMSQVSAAIMIDPWGPQIYL